MSKQNRNSKCGCGSGKKFKVCCLHVPTGTNPERPARQAMVLKYISPIFETGTMLTERDGYFIRQGDDIKKTIPNVIDGRRVHTPNNYPTEQVERMTEWFRVSKAKP